MPKFFKNFWKKLTGTRQKSAKGEMSKQESEPEEVKTPKREEILETAITASEGEKQFDLDAIKKTVSAGKRWVLYKHGTVVLEDGDGSATEAEFVEETKSFLSKNGKVFAGTEFGDFLPSYRPDLNGWIVAYHTWRIVTFLHGAETSEDGDDLSMAFGLVARGMRHKDASELQVAYVHTNVD